MKRLSEPYRTAASAMQRYLTYYAGVTAGDTLTQMFTDLVDLWERAAIDGTPLAEIVGDDPVEFTEAFAQAYAGTRWIDKEQARLTESLRAAHQRED